MVNDKSLYRHNTFVRNTVLTTDLFLIVLQVIISVPLNLQNVAPIQCVILCCFLILQCRKSSAWMEHPDVWFGAFVQALWWTGFIRLQYIPLAVFVNTAVSIRFKKVEISCSEGEYSVLKNICAAWSLTFKGNTYGIKIKNTFFVYLSDYFHYFLHKEGPNVKICLITYDYTDQWRLLNTILQTPYCDIR
jgi:hypothetical protein